MADLAASVLAKLKNKAADKTIEKIRRMPV